MTDVNPVAKVSIRPLKDGENYQTWCVMVKEVLRREDLLEHLEQESPPGTSASTATWKKKDRHARSNLVLHLGEEAITNVTSILEEEASAKEVWDRLKSIYQKDNLQAVFNWQSELYKYCYKDGQDVDKHFQSFENTFVKLASLGSPLTDKEKFAHLLRSLPDSLSHLSSIAGHLNLTYDQIRASIRSEIDRKKSQKQSESTPERRDMPVLGARKAYQKSKNVECFYCGKRGHFAKECRKKRADNKRRNRGGRPFHNQYRNGSGRGTDYNRGGSHSRGANRLSDDRPPSQGSQRHIETRGNDHLHEGRDSPWENRGFLVRCSFMASAEMPQKKETKTWLDSGANVSCVRDRSYFISYTPTDGETVNICEGSSNVKGEGMVEMSLNGKLLQMECKHVPDFDENVISVSSVSKFGRVIFEDHNGFYGFIIEEYGTGIELIRRSSVHGMYPFPSPLTRIEKAYHVSISATEDSLQQHKRLGHPGRDRLLAASRADIGIPTIQAADAQRMECIS